MIVLTDCDEVLCEFLIPAIKIAEQLTGDSYPLESFKGSMFQDFLPEETTKLLDLELSKHGFVTNLKPYPHALEAVAELRKLGCEIFCITSPMEHHPTWGFERMRWVKTHFGIDRHHIGQIAAKYLVQGDIFIDDLPKNVEAWQKKNINGKAFLLRRM